MDFASYKLGLTDSFQGTGVFSSIKLDREDRDKVDASKVLESAKQVTDKVYADKKERETAGTPP